MDKRKILVIDDEEGFLEIVKLSLESTNRYEVDIEADATKAVHKIIQYQPDLVLLDIIMPKMEGPDIASEMRRDSTLNKIPIVFLTATVTQQEVDEGNGRIGGYPFVAKPGSLNILVDTIDQNLMAV